MQKIHLGTKAAAGAENTKDAMDAADSVDDAMVDALLTASGVSLDAPADDSGGAAAAQADARPLPDA